MMFDDKPHDKLDECDDGAFTFADETLQAISNVVLAVSIIAVFIMLMVASW